MGISNPPMFDVRQRLQAQWQHARRHLMQVLLCVAGLWLIWLLERVLPDSLLRLSAWGIRPRTPEGIASIAAAPFVHQSVWQLLANTVSFTVLAWITVLSGRALFFNVCLVTAVTSGCGAWLFGSSSILHSGTGGVMFGLLGFLLARGWFARRLLWALTAFGVCLLYVGSIFGLLRPEEGVSWSSNFWGLAGGAALAWWLYGRRPKAKAAAP